MWIKFNSKLFNVFPTRNMLKKNFITLKRKALSILPVVVSEWRIKAAKRGRATHLWGSRAGRRGRRRLRWTEWPCSARSNGETRRRAGAEGGVCAPCQWPRGRPWVPRRPRGATSPAAVEVAARASRCSMRSGCCTCGNKNVCQNLNIF